MGTYGKTILLPKRLVAPSQTNFYFLDYNQSPAGPANAGRQDGD